jgi:hypothetical protein
MPDPQDPTKLIPTPDLATVRVGQAYDVAVTVQTDPGQLGVFAGYLDLLYDNRFAQLQVAEIQQIHVANASGGSFTLDFGGQEPVAIDYVAQPKTMAAQIQERLRGALATTDIEVEAKTSNTSTVDFLVRFTGHVANHDAPNLTVASQALTGAGAAVSITYEGDLQNGISAYALQDAFRSRGTQLITTIPSDRVYYPNGVSAGLLADRIDDVGAFSTQQGPYPGQLTAAEIAAGFVTAPPRELVRARFVASIPEGATSTSTVFTPSLADRQSPKSDTLVYGRNQAIPLSQLDAGSPRTLTICNCPITAAPDSATIQEDTTAGVVINVLSNDVTMPGTTKKLAEVSVLGDGQGTITKTGDSISFVPAKDFAGTATIVYAMWEVFAGTPLNSYAIGTVSVNVLPVNDRPAFTKGANQQATDESGPQSVPLWATQIAAGPSDELAQTLDFSVVASDPSLFTVQPQLTAAGTLTFTPAPNVSGTTEVTVRLKDNGGRESGGLDESEPQTFTIEIVKEHALHNTAMPLDSSGDGGITAVDALNVIDYINAFGSGAVGEGPAKSAYVDINGDGHVVAGDALEIINYINAFGAKQPPTAADGSEGESTSLLDLLAADTAAQESARRKR